MSWKWSYGVVVGKKILKDASREKKRRESDNGRIEGKNVWVLPSSVAGLYKAEPYPIIPFLGRRIRPKHETRSETCPKDMTRPGRPTIIALAGSSLIKRSHDEHQTASASSIDRLTVVYIGDTSFSRVDPPRVRIQFMIWHCRTPAKRSSISRTTDPLTTTRIRPDAAFSRGVASLLGHLAILGASKNHKGQYVSWLLIDLDIIIRRKTQF